MRTAILLFVYGLAAVTAGPTNPQRIVGGTETTIQQYPEMVALLFSFLGTSFSQSCGGSILNSRAVLTAGHCVVGDPAWRWRLRVGSSMPNSGGVVHNTNRIIIHPGYTTSLGNDIAIIHSATRFSFNNAVRPAIIAGSNYPLADNQVVWATGWGSISFHGPLSPVLRHVQVYTVNQNICRQRYSEIGRSITDNMLCSGVLDIGGRDQCQGDSGGPLFHNRNVVGICSWGERCALPRFPGVNVRVTRYTAWIQANA
ncbi:trypsin, alkaline C isoform X1 [Bombyx mori]|uniref:Peptidase S1 domain-containing protein n=2 Tax=Bombyx mori TaxID=7091 RepID=A0A8R1WJ96_BOMMO|nr:trypsin, alkaline C [Bombyx mori]